VTFVPAVVADEPEALATAAQSSAPAIVVEWAQGSRVNIGAGACPALVTATLDHVPARGAAAPILG
jgi:hypothetical protein